MAGALASIATDAEPVPSVTEGVSRTPTATPIGRDADHRRENLKGAPPAVVKHLCTLPATSNPGERLIGGADARYSARMAIDGSTRVAARAGTTLARAARTTQMTPAAA